MRWREGRFRLRTNLCRLDLKDLWQLTIQLTEIETTFKTIADDLQLLLIYHQLERRIDAHMLVAFVASCPLATLRAPRKSLVPDLTSPPCPTSASVSRCSMSISKPPLATP